MKKYGKRAVALGTGVAAVAVAGIAYAASTAVTSASLGAGDDSVSACQNAANVNYTTAYNTSTFQYDLDHINVTFPNATSAKECDGFDWKLTVENDGTNPVSYGSPTDGAISSNALSIDASGDNIPAEDVTHVAFVVSKATS